MATKVLEDAPSQAALRAQVTKQSNDLIQRECKQFIESTKLIVEANRLGIESHRLRQEAHKLQRQIRTTKRALAGSLDLDVLEARQQALTRIAGDKQAQSVQLLAEVMRMRARLVLPQRQRRTR